MSGLDGEKQGLWSMSSDKQRGEGIVSERVSWLVSVWVVSGICFCWSMDWDNKGSTFL